MTRNARRDRPGRPAPTRRGNSWEFLVPDPTGTRPYISRSFSDRHAGERWQIDSYDAAAAGRPIPDAAAYRTPARTGLRNARPSPRSAVRVGELAWEWWRITYDDEPMSSPSRRTSTAAHIKRYIEPWFDARIDDITQLTEDRARNFMHYLAGHDLNPYELAPPQISPNAKWYTVAEAAEACGVHVSKIKRKIAKGQLPTQREVRNGQTIKGSVRIATADLLAAGFSLDGRDQDGRARRGLSTDYSTEILNTLRAITRLARSRGLISVDPLLNVKASKPRPAVANRKPDTERERALTWNEVRAIAGELNVHHQVALWIQRVLGLRISEAFGLRLSDILDFGDAALVVVQRQGGRIFERRNDYGEIERRPESEMLKTSASYRVLGIPAPLLDLLRTYVDAFHRDLSSHTVDPDRRLILGMREQDTGGQQAYREAFMAAAARLHLDYEHLGFRVTPQLLRKSISVELHSYVEITEHARSRYLGHAYRAHHGGAQMTAISYTPDMLDLQPFITAANGITQLIRQQIGDLFEPPGSYANPGAGPTEPGRAAHVRCVLAEAGWTAGRTGVDVDEAAAQLGLARSTLRARIRRDRIETAPALGPAGDLRVVIPDSSFQELLEQHRNDPRRPGRDPEDLRREAQERANSVPEHMFTIGRLAERLGVGYPTVYQWMLSGRISAECDPTYNVLVVDPGDAERELADAERVTQLHGRSVTVADACTTIGCAHSMIYFWLRTGRLERDGETDQNGVMFITRESVERVATERAEEQRRRRPPPPPPDDLVSLPEAQRLTGHTRGAIQRLVAAGELVRRDHRKRFHIERTSLEAYLARQEAT